MIELAKVILHLRWVKHLFWDNLLFYRVVITIHWYNCHGVDARQITHVNKWVTDLFEWSPLDIWNSSLHTHSSTTAKPPKKPPKNQSVSQSRACRKKGPLFPYYMYEHLLLLFADEHHHAKQRLYIFTMNSTKYSRRAWFLMNFQTEKWQKSTL